MMTTKVAIAFIALSMGGYTISLEDDDTQHPALRGLVEDMAQTNADEEEDYQEYLDALELV